MPIRQRFTLTVAVIFSFLWISSTLATSETRGIRVKLRSKESPGAPVAEEVNLYDSSYALVIGIDSYTNGWPRLSGAVNDARLVADALRKKGFEVTFKKDLNSSQLKETFTEFFIFKGENPNARLFVWFAGHGHTEDGEGYLIPADSPLPEQGAQFRYKALSMRRFGELVRQAKSKHAFAVFDSCFSGTIFTTQRSKPPTAVTRATTLPVRHFLSSGDANQKVSDDGTFRKLFIRAINGEERADANGDGYLTGSELGLFLTDRLTNLTQAAQTPRYGKLRDPDYDRGDFVFLLASSAAIVNPPGKTDRAYSDLDAERKRLEQERRELEQLKIEIERKKLEAERELLETEKKKLSAKKEAPKYASISPDVSKPNFIKYATGVVYDKNTGLEWYAGSDRNTTWNEAKSWVENLNVAGGGWRMPTRQELKNLYKKGAGERNMTPLLKTTGWFVWSGETKGSSSACYFYFRPGYYYCSTRDNSYYKRGFAVRSRGQEPVDETPKYASISPEITKPKVIARDGTFIAYASGVVYDKNTGLEWYAGPDKSTSWNEAERWVENLGVAGGDWRMPTRQELKNLYKKGAGKRSMTPLLKTTGWFVWSGETKGSSSSWYFDFFFGREDDGHWRNRDASDPSRGFAVRSRR